MRRTEVEKAQDLKNQQSIEKLLLDGLESGDPIEVTDEFLKNRRRELHKRLGVGETKKARQNSHAY